MQKKTTYLYKISLKVDCYLSPATSDIFGICMRNATRIVNPDNLDIDENSSSDAVKSS